MMNCIFIVNPVSGKRDAETTVIPKIHQSLAGKGVLYEVVKTEYPGHAREIARAAALKGEPVRLCACGGDGTLSETVSGAYEFPNVEFAAYPCGSGNDFIKCFGEAAQFRDVVAMVEAPSRAVDLLRVNDSICMNIVSVGIDADVANAMNRWRQHRLFRGQIAYDLATLECILKPLGKRLRIRLNGEEIEGSFTLAVAGNGRVYGGHYMATPRALVDDGIIDLVVVDKISLLRLVRVLGVYQRGEHLSEDGAVLEPLRDCMRYYRTDRVELDGESEFCVNIDGEITRSRHIDIEMLHHKMRFVVPGGGASESPAR